MKKRLVFLRVLAVVQIVIVGLVALVASFADGGHWWERFALSVVQPVSAVLMLVLVMQSAPSATLVRAATAVLSGHVILNAGISVTILTGISRGDWYLPLIFVVVPLIVLSYCLHLRRGR